MGCSGSKAAAKPSTTEAVAPAPAPAKEAQAVTLEADAVPPTAGIVDTVEAQVGISEMTPKEWSSGTHIISFYDPISP